MVLDNLVSNGVPGASDQVDRKRKVRIQPESHKDKSDRHDDHQRSWHHMKNITSRTSVSWTEPLCLRSDWRKPTKTTPENLPSKDVMELKQATLWHGDRQYINQANDASVEGVTSLLRWCRSRFKPRKLESHESSEFATELLSSPASICLSSSSHHAEVKLCENVVGAMQAIRLYVAATVRSD